MRKYSDTLPKTLLPVAGRPFADWQLSWLASQGFDNVVYSIGYAAEQVRTFVDNGRRWGLHVDYVEERDRLLGTGGATRLAVDSGLLEESFYVMYGDSYLQLDVADVERAYVTVGLPAMMTIFKNHDQWVSSNVGFDGHLVRHYGNRGPIHDNVRYVDYGLTKISRSDVVASLPQGERSDLAVLFRSLIADSKLAGYEVLRRFYEIGSPEGLRDLEAHLLGEVRGPTS